MEVVSRVVIVPYGSTTGFRSTANCAVPPPEKPIAASAHPPVGGDGYRMAALRDHTSTRRAHITVDPNNTPSLAVAASLGAAVGAMTVEPHGRSLLRYSLEL